MIAIRIEMWPHGDESRKREIGFGTIANVGGTPEVADYRVRLMKSPEYAKRRKDGKPLGAWKTGKVLGFRRRKLGPWDLLLIALIRCISARHDGPLPTLEEIEAASEIQHPSPGSTSSSPASPARGEARA